MIDQEVHESALGKGQPLGKGKAESWSQSPMPPSTLAIKVSVLGCDHFRVDAQQAKGMLNGLGVLNRDRTGDSLPAKCRMLAAAVVTELSPPRPNGLALLQELL